MSNGALIWCPFPNEEEARHAIETLLDQKLIACANLFPGMTSLFVWEGKAAEATEVGVLCKTRTDLLQEAVDRLSGLHSYDCPAIVGWQASVAAAETQNWLSALGTGGDRL